MKQLDLEVEPTDACVKADRALTLFMINTLAENARKVHSKGGKVRIYARQENDLWKYPLRITDAVCLRKMLTYHRREGV